jgi:hypothetical protein
MRPTPGLRWQLTVLAGVAALCLSAATARCPRVPPMPC